MTFCGDWQGTALSSGSDAPDPDDDPDTDDPDMQVREQQDHAPTSRSPARNPARAPTRHRHPPADDATLMRHVADGCDASFAALVERHAAALYRVAARMLGDAHEAQDVVQDCFARLWQHAPRWTPTGAGLVGWLHRVTMNLCFDRKRRLRVVVTDDLPETIDTAPLADRVIETRQAREEVARALADLPERYRAALVLCYYEDLSNALAAQVLDLNIKAMESLLFRARRQMRELLEARGINAGDVAFCGAQAMTGGSSRSGASPFRDGRP